ncbi:NifB/NifX family molybdenum-iron cluster-binding protein [archaeon]|nr:NifB/NifX family molybdenum-iron cluster-binding protein [archaeon]
MKVATASTGDTIDSQVSPFFGRCPYFLIVEFEDKEIKASNAITNTAMNQQGGAGISAAQLVGNQKVESVIAGAIGPQAFSMLQQLNIKAFTAVPETVKSNVLKLAGGELQEMSSFSRPIGPKGMGFGPVGGQGRHGQRGRR